MTKFSRSLCHEIGGILQIYMLLGGKIHLRGVGNLVWLVNLTMIGALIFFSILKLVSRLQSQINVWSIINSLKKTKKKSHQPPT